MVKIKIKDKFQFPTIQTSQKNKSDDKQNIIKGAKSTHLKASRGDKMTFYGPHVVEFESTRPNCDPWPPECIPDIACVL